MLRLDNKRLGEKDLVNDDDDEEEEEEEEEDGGGGGAGGGQGNTKILSPL